MRNACSGGYGLERLTVEREKVAHAGIAEVAVNGHHLGTGLHIIAVEHDAVGGTALDNDRTFERNRVPLPYVDSIDTLLRHKLTILIDEHGEGGIRKGEEAA